MQRGGPIRDFESLVAGIAMRPQLFLITGTFEEALGLLGATSLGPSDEFIVWVNHRFGQGSEVAWQWTVYQELKGLPLADALTGLLSLIREFAAGRAQHAEGDVHESQAVVTSDLCRGRPSHTELIESVLRRPRMFSDAQTLRELLLFISGICCGRHPPHGSACLAGFKEYVQARFGHTTDAAWTAVLQQEFENRPFFEASASIAELLHEWKSGRQ